MKKELEAIIKELERCAKQNEEDAGCPGGYDSDECKQAWTLAVEQRRMLKILKALLRKVT